MDGRKGTAVTGYNQEDAVRGTVRFFDDAKGFGKIDCVDVPGGEAFVHFSNILSQNKRRTLQPEQQVEFVPVLTDKGWRALGVRVVIPDDPKTSYSEWLEQHVEKPKSK